MNQKRKRGARIARWRIHHSRLSLPAIHPLSRKDSDFTESQDVSSTVIEDLSDSKPYLSGLFATSLLHSPLEPSLKTLPIFCPWSQAGSEPGTFPSCWSIQLKLKHSWRTEPWNVASISPPSLPRAEQFIYDETQCIHFCPCSWLSMK